LVEGWECVLVDSEYVSPLGNVIEEHTGLRVRYLEEVCYTLTQPANVLDNESVRQLTMADLELLASAHPALRAGLWATRESYSQRASLLAP
jgi:hypothetical protein